MSERLSPADGRLVAALTVLRDQLGPVVDELLAGELGEVDRAELAMALFTVAEELVPPVVAVVEPDRGRAVLATAESCQAPAEGRAWHDLAEGETVARSAPSGTGAGRTR